VKTLRQLSVSLLVASTAVLAACGHAGSVNTAPALRASTGNVVMAAGKARKLGYNADRYVHTQQQNAHPQHLVSRAYGRQP
jgi:hypothetical protein